MCGPTPSPGMGVPNATGNHTHTHSPPPPQSAVTCSAPRATIKCHEAELTSPKLTGAFGLAINTSHTMAALPVAQETSHL